MPIVLPPAVPPLDAAAPQLDRARSAEVRQTRYHAYPTLRFDDPALKTIDTTGYVIGAQGFYRAATTTGVEPFVPADGSAPQGTLIVVQGIMTDEDRAKGVLQGLANDGYAVFGVMVDTHGMLRDIAASIGDKGSAKNPAVDTVAALIKQELGAATPARFVGHSRGALVIDRAIHDLKWAMQDHMSLGEAERKLANIEVEVLGDTVMFRQMGPHYTIYDNRADPVPWSGSRFPIHFVPSQTQWHRFVDHRATGVVVNADESRERQLADRINQQSHGINPANGSRVAEPYAKARSDVERARNNKPSGD